MPRSGWLAAGTVVGAAVAPLAGARGPAILLAVLCGLIVAGSLIPRGGQRITLPVAIGIGVIALRLAIGPAGPVLAGAPTGEGPWSMVVESVGSPRDGRQVATLRSISTEPSGFRVAATLPRYPVIEPGDVILVEGRARPRPDSPYGAYLERIGAWGTLDIRRLEVGTSGEGMGRRLERLRRAAGEVLADTLPEPEAGLAAGILIGLRDRVDREVASAFTTAGISHIVAISGWNIAIVAAAVAAVLGRARRRRRAIVTSIAIFAYVAFAGASPSVVRAGAMAGVVLLARETGRAGYAAAALGWAVVLLLLADPGLLADAGFQLSTVATAGLIAWASPLSERIERLGRGHLPDWLVESLGVSLAAQAATLPLVLATFGRLALIAPLVNLLVVPLVAPVMAAGVVGLAAGTVVALGGPGWLAAICAAPAWVGLRMIIGITQAAAALPLATVALPEPAGVVAGLGLTIGAGAVMLARRRTDRTGRAGARMPGGRHPARSFGSTGSSGSAGPGRRRSNRPTHPSRIWRAALLILVASVAVTGGVIAARPAGVPRVIVLDVGQGDSILVEGSRGGRVLVDGGPDPDRLLVALDRRIPPWDRRIDALVLTHPHEDHLAGFVLLMDRYRIGQVLETGMPGPGPAYAAWDERLNRPGAPERLRFAAGDGLTIDEVELTAVWPDRDSVPTTAPDSGSEINDQSIVLLGAIGRRRFLLTGDVEEGVDPGLVARGLPSVDLLKVAHHGSRTATTEAFLAMTQPTLAVISVGADNRYGHPAGATLDRLGQNGARILRTDLDGTVSVAFGPAGLTVQTERRVTTGRTDRLRYHRTDEPTASSRSSHPAVVRTAAGAIVVPGRRQRRHACRHHPGRGSRARCTEPPVAVRRRR